MDNIQEMNIDVEKDRVASMNPLCVVGINKLIWKADRSFKEVGGYTTEELEQAPITSFLHPRDVLGFEKELKKLNGGKASFEITCRLRKKDGKFVKQHWLVKKGLGEKSDRKSVV